MNYWNIYKFILYNHEDVEFVSETYVYGIIVNTKGNSDDIGIVPDNYIIPYEAYRGDILPYKLSSRYKVKETVTSVILKEIDHMLENGKERNNMVHLSFF